jgi:hypothetical protein
MDMGKLICVADPAEAAARDEAFFSKYDGSIMEIPPFPPIADGVVLAGSPAAGELFIQGELDDPSGRNRFDDVVGVGWRLVTLVDADMDADLSDWFARISGRVVPIGCSAAAAADVDDAYRKWFAERGVVAALQRPDFAVFGTATETAQIAALVHGLRDVLQSA